MRMFVLGFRVQAVVALVVLLVTLGSNFSQGLVSPASPGAAEVVVALTRELGKNGKLAACLARKSIESVELPCIAHAEGEDRGLLGPRLASGGFGYVAVTSPEAAKVFLEGWEEAGRPRVAVACVGTATGEVLRKRSVEPVFSPSKANAETLASELPETSPATVLYPASARAQRTLEEGLAARGFHVTRLNTYDTVPAVWSDAELALALGTRIAAFGSPSAAKTWAARCGTSSCIAACIGETSANACRKLGWKEESIFYPDSPGMEGWADAVRAAIDSMKMEIK